MYFKTITLVVLAAASLANAQLESIDVGATPSQSSKFRSDYAAYVTSATNKPEYTSLLSEIRPYLTDVKAATSYVGGALPTNAAQVSTWITQPLIYLTAQPEPSYIAAMPSSIRSDYTSYIHEQISAAASIASKDLFSTPTASSDGNSGGSGGGGNAAPRVAPGLGWILGSAAAAVGVAAVML